MDHVIETKRLCMRPYTREDVGALRRLWTEALVRRHLLDDKIVSRAWTSAEVGKSITSFAERGFGQWAVRERGRDALIGFCGYREFHDPGEIQLFYGIAPDHWGRGNATEAARAMIRHGFEALGFDPIVASADVPNSASLRVMEKAGMRHEKTVVLDGRDTAVYGLTRAEFEANQAAPEARASAGASPR